MPSAGIGMILSTMQGSISQREAYLDLGGYGEDLRILDRLNEREKLVPYLKIDPARQAHCCTIRLHMKNFRLFATKAF